MMQGTIVRRRRPWLKRALFAVGLLLIVLVIATLAVWRFYSENLKPVTTGNAAPQEITVEPGASPRQIANLLHDKALIRNAWTFEAYVRHEGAAQAADTPLTRTAAARWL